MATSTTALTATAVKKSRRASEFPGIQPAGIQLTRIRGGREQVAEAANGLNHVDAELLAQPADEDLDRVGGAVEILVVEMLDELGARHHAAGVVHQVGEQPVLVRSETDRVAGDTEAGRAG